MIKNYNNRISMRFILAKVNFRITKIMVRNTRGRSMSNFNSQ